MQFNDVTCTHNIPQDSGWSTGVSVVDINNDGLLDIYVCRVGNYESIKKSKSVAGLRRHVKTVYLFMRTKQRNMGLIFRDSVHRLHFWIMTWMVTWICT